MSQAPTSSPIAAHLQNSLAALECCQADTPLRSRARRIAISAVPTVQAGKKLLIVGSVGIAADAQHMAAEIVGRDTQARRAYATVALTTDTSALTAIGNDHGFEHVFARQAEELGQRGDVSLALTTSGHSLNILWALSKARELGLVAIGFSGIRSQDSESLCDHLLVVHSEHSAIIQQSYRTFAHGVYEVEHAIRRQTAARGSSRK